VLGYLEADPQFLRPGIKQELHETFFGEAPVMGRSP